MARPYQIYTAESSVRDLKSLFKSMAMGLRTSRYSAYRIFIKDVRAEYTRSFMGVFWDFADPLALGLIFYFLRRSRVIDAGPIAIPYSAFIIYGLMIYQTFTDSVMLSMDVMRRSRSIVTQLKVPPEALIGSAIYRAAFNSIFRIAVMLAFSLVTGAFSLVGFTKFLLLYPSIILAGLSIGVLLAPFSILYNDVGRAVRIALTLGRYASPVLYAIPTVAPFSYLYTFNPIAPILSNLRSLATENLITDVPGLAIRLGIMGAMFLLGWFIFHVSMPIVAERT